MTKLEKIFNQDILNKFNNVNTNKLKEVAKIDYNLQSYIRKHTEVLMSVGNTEEEASSLIFNRLKEAVNTVDNEKAL